jgi:VWFA-related protein
MRMVLSLAILFACAAAAQEDSGETFKSGVTLIQVPVTVRDHDGHVVSNLTKDDFQLFDNGKRQEIVSFSLENAGAQTIPDRSLPPEGSPAQPAAPKPLDVPERFIAYFFDDLNMGNLIEIREAAQKQIDALEPGDRAAIFTSASCKGLQDFTNDKQRLHQALNRVQPGALAMCQVAPIQQLQLELLKAIVRRMSNLPGRRDIILVSSGFFVGHDRSDEQAQLIDVAARAKVTIDALDAGGGGAPNSYRNIAPEPSADQSPMRRMEPPRASYAGNDLVLTELAHGTGGAYVTGNDFAFNFRRLATPESHYVLGFAPASKDGRYHKLKVQLENAHKLTVEARAGYDAPKGSE